MVMYTKKIKVVVLLVICIIWSNAVGRTQNSIQVTLYNSCQYSGFNQVHPLYQFPIDTVANIIDAIIATCAAERNFELVASNVSSVVAAIDSSGKRWIFYSKSHFLLLNDDDYRLALIAHAVGHHLIGHLFSQDPVIHEKEEVEADEFMGFVLYRLGVLKSSAITIVNRFPMEHGALPGERQAAVMRGFSRGEASVLVSGKNAFYDDGTGNSLAGIPEFPFPVPEVSASCEFHDRFSRCNKLADVDSKLVQALKRCGYFEYRYYYVKNGFALVTRMEQMYENGYSMDAHRWDPKPMREETFSLTSFFTSLFTSGAGYFRVFVFIVREDPLSTEANKTMRPEDARKWLNEGMFRLPPAIGRIPFTPSTTVAALVYEFRISESTSKASQSLPSKLDGNTHLVKAKILSYLP